MRDHPHACIALSRGLHAIVDEDDLAILGTARWHASSGVPYARRNERRDGLRGVVYMHRLILAAPVGLEIDHINGDTLDNWRANLRLCTKKENLRARRVFRSNSLGVKGVHLFQGRFRAQIRVNGQRRSLGMFKTLEEARAAYEAAALEAFGDYAGH